MAPSAGCVVFPTMLNRWAIEVEKVNNWVHPGLGFAHKGALKGESGKEVGDICKRKKAQQPSCWRRKCEVKRLWLFLLKRLEHIFCFLLTTVHCYIAASWRNRCYQMWCANELQTDELPSWSFYSKVVLTGCSWAVQWFVPSECYHNCQSMHWGYIYPSERMSIPNAYLYVGSPARSAC